ncbi:hypothetical protein GNF18_07245 [Ligilactobacillus pobuzihii]|uniref:hypothetical protein n=1 Tax=Ligilactobacillus pobuzihii TaxID=449659 RepID=UPI0019D0FDC0|nr:hypothetical protein [Ligilactobacillus pobuzihii]MBN7274930.1 hypothetical protein [Ligilactobacillus pobuzihii]
MEFLWNNGVLAVVSLIIVIVVNFFYVRNVNQKVVNGGNKILAILVLIISFIPSVDIAIFLGLNTGDIGSSVFGFTFSFEFVVIGLIYYFALFFNAKKEIKEEKTSKNAILNKYFNNNAILGYATAHYMSGIIMLMVSVGNTFLYPAMDFLPDNPMGGIAALVLMILYIFVLPGYIILKTPKLFIQFLNKI